MSDTEFKVSGDDDVLLQKTIELVFLQHNPYSNNATAKSWAVVKGVGLVFYWYKTLKETNPLPVDLKADGVYAIVKPWLESDEAKNVLRLHEYQGGDGSYKNGWEVTNYHSESNSAYQILVVRPVEIYYGK
ncbi:hypothetical protein [Stenotrophomonas phage RAS14]